MKGNETLKEGDCLIPIDKIEGTVYKFQSGKNWNGVDSNFKQDLIDAMCELYCDYKKRGEAWTILEISSAYRDAKNQARVMIDTYIDQGRRKMSSVYASRWDKAVDLISDLYYDGNHLSCKGRDIEGMTHPCKHGSIISCKATEQKALLNRLPSNEQNIFTGDIELKNNKEEAKKILEAWINVSNVLSNHTKGKAIDFSKNNYSQHKRFKEILEKTYGLTAKDPYPAGNFHVEPK